MGASGWTYFVPHEPDPEQALQQLRQQVFAAGDYRKPGELPPALHPFARGLPFPLRLLLAGLRAYQAVSSALRWMLGDSGRPRTFDEALELAGEDGTHSILDITHTAPQHEFAAAVPLSEAQLQRALGTTQPTHEQVQAAGSHLLERLDRWDAVYLPVYLDGKPVEWAFLGCSGD
jgi:hypothetical protein